MKIIDVHTHGIGGFDTRSASMDPILRIAEIHGASGVSEVVLSIYSAPIPVMRQQMALVRQAIELQCRVSSAECRGEKALEHHPPVGNVGEPIHRCHDVSGPRTQDSRPSVAAARILGLHLEGPFLSPARCGALEPASFLEPRERTFRSLIDGFEDVVKVITVAPELNGAPALIRQLVDRGIIVSMGHSDATYGEAEKGWRAGARGVTHLFNAMASMHHREPGIAGFGLVNADMYVEVIGDPHHLHPATLRMIFTMKKPERILIVSDTVRETKLNGRGRAVIDAQGKLLGGSMTVTASAERLIGLGFDTRVVWKTVTTNPARYLRP